MDTRLVSVLFFSLLGYSVGEDHVYGKYFWQDKYGQRHFDQNTYYMFKPTVPKSGQKSPLIMQFYGSDWRSYLAWGPMRTQYPAIRHYNDAGFTFVSTSYRTLDQDYYYEDAAGQVKREEFINIDSDGRLSLDTTGKTMADYKVSFCFMEKVTKCMYDVTQSLQHLIAKADEIGIDTHRMVFIASSAGTAEASYLAFVYHKFHAAEFTPIGMVLSTPQLDLPISCTQDWLWKGLSPYLEAGENTPLGTIFSQAYCQAWIGCHEGDMNHGRTGNVSCNRTWTTATDKRYCDSAIAFNTATVGKVIETQRWRPSDSSMPDFARNLQKLWRVSENMLAYQPPKPFHILVHPEFRSAGTFQHLQVYIQQWADFADRAGIDYTVFWTAYEEMKADMPILTHSSVADQTRGQIMDAHYASSSKPTLFTLLKVPKFTSAAPCGGKLSYLELHKPFICHVVGSCPVDTPSVHSLFAMVHAHIFSEGSRLNFIAIAGFSIFAFAAALGVIRTRRNVVSHCSLAHDMDDEVELIEEANEALVKMDDI